MSEKFNVTHCPYSLSPDPRLTALNYFFVQTPPEQSGPQPKQISILDARRRIREVHYDRGTIVNQMDIEAKEMADCRKRFDSFSKSEYLRGKVASYQLAQLGFFFVGDGNAVGKLRCSFCRRTIHLFLKEDVAFIEKDWERRLISLVQRHSHLSATCPLCLRLNGDNIHITSDDIKQITDTYIRNQYIQYPIVNISSVSHVDDFSLRTTMLNSMLTDGFPPLDRHDLYE